MGLQRHEQRSVTPRDVRRGTPVVSRGTTQLKVGLRVRDLESSCALYLRLGFRQIPRPDEPRLRYLTFGPTWLILSDREDAYWARIFYGLDPDGYELMFEQHHAINEPA
jgi:lactoylglutathione lyase